MLRIHLLFWLAMTMSTFEVTGTDPAQVIRVFYPYGDCETPQNYETYRMVYNVSVCSSFGSLNMEYFCSRSGDFVYQVLYSDPSCNATFATTVLEIPTVCNFLSHNVRLSCANPIAGPPLPFPFPPLGWIQSSACFNASDSYHAASTCAASSDPNIKCMRSAHINTPCQADAFSGSFFSQGCTPNGDPVAIYYSDSSCYHQVGAVSTPTGCRNGVLSTCASNSVPMLPISGYKQYDNDACSNSTTPTSTVLFTAPDTCFSSQKFSCNAVNGTMLGTLTRFTDSTDGTCPAMSAQTNVTQAAGVCQNRTQFMCGSFFQSCPAFSAIMAPTNGNLGTCGSITSSFSACFMSCNPGYILLGQPYMCMYGASYGGPQICTPYQHWSVRLYPSFLQCNGDVVVDPVTEVLYLACGSSGVLAISGSTITVIVSPAKCPSATGVYRDGISGFIYASCSGLISSYCIYNDVANASSSIITISGLAISNAVTVPRCSNPSSVFKDTTSGIVFVVCFSEVFSISGPNNSSISSVLSCMTSISVLYRDHSVGMLYLLCNSTVVAISGQKVITIDIVRPLLCPMSDTLQTLAFARDAATGVIYTNCQNGGIIALAGSDYSLIASSAQCQTVSSIYHDPTSGIVYALCGPSYSSGLQLVSMIESTVTVIASSSDYARCGSFSHMYKNETGDSMFVSCTLGSIISFSSPCAAPSSGPCGATVTGGARCGLTCDSAKSVCSVACTAGFSPQGPKYICFGNVLSAGPQVCVPNSCSPMDAADAPANGGLGACGLAINSSTTCSMTCNSGYALQGSPYSCYAGEIRGGPQFCNPLWTNTTIGPQIQCAEVRGIYQDPATGLATVICGANITSVSGIGAATIATGCSYLVDHSFDASSETLFSVCIIEGIISVFSMQGQVEKTITMPPQCYPSSILKDSKSGILYVGCGGYFSGPGGVVAISGSTTSFISTSAQCYNVIHLYKDYESGVIYATCSSNICDVISVIAISGTGITPLAYANLCNPVGVYKSSTSGILYLGCANGVIAMFGSNMTMIAAPQSSQGLISGFYPDEASGLLYAVSQGSDGQTESLFEISGTTATVIAMRGQCNQVESLYKDRATGNVVLACATSFSESWIGTFTAQVTITVLSPTCGAFSNGTCSQITMNEANCSIACEPGYTLVGAPYICRGGKFASGLQYCSPNPCPAMSTSISNGTIGNCGSTIVSGSTCSITCSSGFVIQGSAYLCSAGALTGGPQSCASLPATVQTNDAPDSGSSSSGLSRTTIIIIAAACGFVFLLVVAILLRFRCARSLGGKHERETTAMGQPSENQHPAAGVEMDQITLSQSPLPLSPSQFAASQAEGPMFIRNESEVLGNRINEKNSDRRNQAELYSDASDLMYGAARIAPIFTGIFAVIGFALECKKDSVRNRSNLRFFAERLEAMQPILASIRQHWLQMAQDSGHSDEARSRVTSMIPVFESAAREFEAAKALIVEIQSNSAVKKFGKAKTFAERLKVQDDNIQKVVQNLLLGLNQESVALGQRVLNDLHEALPYISEQMDEIVDKINIGAVQLDQVAMEVKSDIDNVNDALMSMRRHMLSMKRAGVAQKEADNAKKLEMLLQLLNANPGLPLLPSSTPIHLKIATSVAIQDEAVPGNDSSRVNSESVGSSATSSAIASNNGSVQIHLSPKHSASFMQIDEKDVELIEERGRGSFGVVYLGEWAGQEVAVKKLVTGGMSQEQILRDFGAELSILCSIRHNRLLQVYGACLSASNPFIVTEWMSRGSLFDCVHHSQVDCRPPRSLLLHMAVEVAEGLVYMHIAHKPPMIHRDLKLQNILVGKDYSCKIADFGLAKIAEESGYLLQSSNGVGGGGTLAFMAPEQLRDPPAPASTATDVYSFGVVLWEMFTSQIPYQGLSVVKVLSRMQAGVFLSVDMDGLPDVLKPLLHSIFQLNPINRPSIREVLLRLKQARDEISESQIIRGKAFSVFPSSPTASMSMGLLSKLSPSPPQASLMSSDRALMSSRRNNLRSVSQVQEQIIVAGEFSPFAQSGCELQSQAGIPGSFEQVAYPSTVPDTP